MTIVYRRLCVTEFSMVKAIGFSESFANASEQFLSLPHPQAIPDSAGLFSPDLVRPY